MNETSIEWGLCLLHQHLEHKRFLEVRSIAGFNASQFATDIYQQCRKACPNKAMTVHQILLSCYSTWAHFSLPPVKLQEPLANESIALLSPQEIVAAIATINIWHATANNTGCIMQPCSWAIVSNVILFLGRQLSIE
jgi:hypothetical protein